MFDRIFVSVVIALFKAEHRNLLGPLITAAQYYANYVALFDFFAKWTDLTRLDLTSSFENHVIGVIGK